MYIHSALSNSWQPSGTRWPNSWKKFHGGRLYCIANTSRYLPEDCQYHFCAVTVVPTLSQICQRVANNRLSQARGVIYYVAFVRILPRRLRNPPCSKCSKNPNSNNICSLTIRGIHVSVLLHVVRQSLLAARAVKAGGYLLP